MCGGGALGGFALRFEIGLGLSQGVGGGQCGLLELADAGGQFVLSFLCRARDSAATLALLLQLLARLLQLLNVALAGGGEGLEIGVQFGFACGTGCETRALFVGHTLESRFGVTQRLTRHGGPLFQLLDLGGHLGAGLGGGLACSRVLLPLLLERGRGFGQLSRGLAG